MSTTSTSESVTVTETPKGDPKGTTPDPKVTTPDPKTNTPAPKGKPADPLKIPEGKPAETPTTDKAPPPDFKSTVAALEKEFTETGEVTEATLKMAEDVGLKPDFVKTFIEGQKAITAMRSNELFSVVGTQESYTEIQKWAANELSAEEKNAFNDAVSKGFATGDLKDAKALLTAMKARYEADNGSEGKQLGGSKGTSGVKPFASMFEYTTAVKDPRYQKDHSYRDKVNQRLFASGDLT